MLYKLDRFSWTNLLTKLALCTSPVIYEIIYSIRNNCVLWANLFAIVAGCTCSNNYKLKHYSDFIGTVEKNQERNINNMKMSIQRRSLLVWNTIVFSILSIFFLFVVECLSLDVPALDLLQLKQFGRSYLIYIIFGLYVLYQTYSLKKKSQFFLSLFAVIIFLKSTSFIFIKFDKIVLFLVFIYAIVAYYYCILWIGEIFESYYTPLFDQYDLFNRIPIKFHCELTIGTDISIPGYLSNWNNNGCYIRFDNSLSDKLEKGEKKIRKRLRKEVKLDFSFADRKFCQQAVIMSIYNSGEGVGFKFSDNLIKEKNCFDWHDFHTAIQDRGLVPKYLL